MRIKEEDFNKLKQLDRIEYRQRRSLLENYFYYRLDFTGYFVILILIFVTMSFLNDFDALSYEVVSAFYLIMQIIIYAILIEIGLKIFYTFMRIIKIKELNNKYFKVITNK